MSEHDLELLITMDDPGEDTLEEDTFHQNDNTIVTQPFSYNCLTLSNAGSAE